MPHDLGIKKLDKICKVQLILILNNKMTKLTAEQSAELKKAFEVMDANKDGVVTKEELSQLLKGLGEDVTDEVVEEMIKIADDNGDGKIQFEEFVKAATEGNM